MYYTIEQFPRLFTQPQVAHTHPPQSINPDYGPVYSHYS